MGSESAVLFQEGPLGAHAWPAFCPWPGLVHLAGAPAAHAGLRLASLCPAPEPAQTVLGLDQIVMVTLTRVQTPATLLWSFKTEG